MLPSDYKRKYQFKTDNSREKKIMNITVAVLIIMVVAWYAYKYFFQ